MRFDIIKIPFQVFVDIANPFMIEKMTTWDIIIRTIAWQENISGWANNYCLRKHIKSRCEFPCPGILQDKYVRWRGRFKAIGSVTCWCQRMLLTSARGRSSDLGSATSRSQSEHSGKSIQFRSCWKLCLRGQMGASTYPRVWQCCKREEAHSSQRVWQVNKVIRIYPQKKKKKKRQFTCRSFTTPYIAVEVHGQVAFSGSLRK